jgi:Reverse transcriptase (RNA-dependent DNA polymerase)
MSITQLLIEHGYFPAELPSPFSTKSYAANLDKLPADPTGIGPKSSRCAYHSIPRLQHSRRLLGLPNPLHQLKLAFLVERHWSEIEKHMAQSPLSLTSLHVNPEPPRALSKAAQFDDLDTERVLRSSASRFLLKADLSRFYHTLYTHSIPWALHTKDTAKAQRNNKSLFGNVIDEAVRNTQDQQTIGIPVGPDTSDLISEILGVALDMQLLEANPHLSGLRFVDDYYLYFATRSEAESALADLHRVASHFAVEINPLKTMIRELPESLQPAWKSELRSQVIRPDQERQDLLGLFSSAFENATRYPGNNVLKFAVKQSTGRRVSVENWKVYESFLLGSLVSEPNLAPTLAPILIKYRDDGYPIDSQKLLNSCAEVALYHAKLRQGFEVAWALWLCKLFSLELPQPSLRQVSLVDDPIVALLMLDLRNLGLADGLDPSMWLMHMQPDHLYSENWLLAYEAYVRGWLPSADGMDYVATDAFFGVLARNNIRFYDDGTTEAAGDAGWIEGY